MAESPDLRRRLTVARTLGLSLREFDGWTPAETTTVVEWDDQGRPAKWVTRRESVWDRRERSWMLALDYYEAGLCRKCGQPLHESTDPDNDPDNPDAHHQYVAEVPVECLSCKVLVRSESKWAKDQPDLAPALIHTAVLVDKKPRRRRAGRG